MTVKNQGADAPRSPRVGKQWGTDGSEGSRALRWFSDYRWWVVVMLWLVCVFNYADRQAIFSVFPLLKTEMHLSDIELGLVGSAFMWVYALALPLAGVVADRVSRKTLILAGLIFWSAITLATALATTYWQLLLFRALEGFGEAFYFPASMALISDYHGRRTRSCAMALHQSGVYIGTILGGTLAGFMAEQYGWRSGFYVFGILGALLGVVLIWLLKEPQRGDADLPALLTAIEEAARAQWVRWLDLAPSSVSAIQRH